MTATALSRSKPDGGLLADRATEHIRGLIVSGRLGSGDRLNEVEIAEALNISRGPVREAVRRFASSGLVVSSPNLGSRVVDIDAVSIRGLYEVREALEALAARLAAMRMNEPDKARLTAMLDEHEAAMRSETSDAYPAGNADWDFHLAVLAGSENDFAWRICGTELRDLFSLLRARHGQVPGRGRAALNEHRQIAQAIVEGEADFAAVLMAQHIRHSYKNLCSLIDGEKPGAGNGDMR